MSVSEVYRCWEWPLTSNPADFWPLISNTDRFNADSGVPRIERLDSQKYLRSLRLSKLGVTVEWEEEPFEWVRPERFGVVRRYKNGPLAEMRVLAELLQSPGRRLRYQVWAKPRNLLGRVLVALQLTESGVRFGRTVRRYDEAAGRAKGAMPLPEEVSPLAAGGREVIDRCCRELLAAGCDPEAAGKLCGYVERVEDRDAARMRPYALAEAWGKPRRATLEMFLRAAHGGMLELQWDLLCPSCRGAKQSAASLAECDARVHCDACQIDYSADFARNVELTFRPAAAVREVTWAEYCVGGPQNTPHIVMQQILGAGERKTVRAALEPGAYRYREWGKPGGGTRVDVAAEDGVERAVLEGSTGAMVVRVGAELALDNRASETRVMVLERTAWSDLAATAAEVTALPVFRELFAQEAPRAGGEAPIEDLTVMFTNLQGTTRRCEELGDATALRLLRAHTAVVEAAVKKAGGTVVKTMGDRAMAVFPEPAGAVRAGLEAQRVLGASAEPVALRVGVNRGALIAVSMNERLDYFGATVNRAAQLCDSAGAGLALSDEVACDEEVRGVLARAGMRA